MPPQQIAAGNIDLTNRPRVQNPDGSISTVRSISINEDGKEILIPTVSPDGRILSNQDAIDLWHRTGQHLGIFRDAASATAFAQQLHQSEAQKLMPPQTPQWGTPIPVRSGRGGGAGPNTGNAPMPSGWGAPVPVEPETPNVMSRVLEPITRAANPVEWAKGAFGLALAALSPEHRDAFLSSLATHALNASLDARESVLSGHPGQAMLEAGSAFPVVGAPFERFAHGDVAGGVGESIALAGQLATLKLPESVRVPGITNPNPAEAAAAAFGAAHDIPVDAATATGNAGIKGAQFLADRSITGSVVSGRAKAAQQSGLERVGGELSAQVHPTATTGYQAGEAVASDIGDVIDNLRTSANKAYGRLRQIEAQNTQTIQTGTKVENTGILDSAGKPITRTIPITENISLPVDMRPVKTALKPILDRMMRQMPVAQQQASGGLRAIQNIIEGNDYVSASAADADLSAIKNIARADNTALRDVSQGLAAKAVDELDAAVRQAVAQGGPDATKALLEGRTATRAKYQAADVLDQLRDEPVQAFQQATWSKDAGIDKLAAVAVLAPNQLPKIGRAFLDNLIETATAEGGFSKGGTLWSKWNNLGPKTKQLLFQQPGLVSDLDNFFLLAKKIGENPNPSGTGAMVSIGAQGALLWTNPVTGAAVQLGSGALSKLFHSSTGVQLLTSGFKIPIRSPAATTWFTEIQKIIDQAPPKSEAPDDEVVANVGGGVRRGIR